MRVYVKKTNRGEIPPDKWILAIKAVVESGMSVAQAAREYDVPRKSLLRNVKKYSSNQNSLDKVPGHNKTILHGYSKHKQVKISVLLIQVKVTLTKNFARG